jgi:hypothetical protein
MGRGLGEQQLAVAAHLEDAAAPLDQLDGEPEAILNRIRQTGGSGQVVSDDAVLDGDLRHAALFYIVLGCRRSESARRGAP